MILAFKLIGVTLGLVAGFILGLMALMHITKGESLKAVIADKDKKIWLGLLAWSFAGVGAWLGWELVTYLAYANR